jgi:hypothetical protein
VSTKNVPNGTVLQAKTARKNESAGQSQTTQTLMLIDEFIVKHFNQSLPPVLNILDFPNPGNSGVGRI